MLIQIFVGNRDWNWRHTWLISEGLKSGVLSHLINETWMNSGFDMTAAKILPSKQ